MRNPIKKAAGPTAASQKNLAHEFTASRKNSSENSAHAQRVLLLRELRVGPVSTLDARSRLGICHPGARIMELRESGHLIGTFWAIGNTADGTPHRVARYVLLAGSVA